MTDDIRAASKDDEETSFGSAEYRYNARFNTFISLTSNHQNHFLINHMQEAFTKKKMRKVVLKPL